MQFCWYKIAIIPYVVTEIVMKTFACLWSFHTGNSFRIDTPSVAFGSWSPLILWTRRSACRCCNVPYHWFTPLNGTRGSSLTLWSLMWIILRISDAGEDKGHLIRNILLIGDGLFWEVLFLFVALGLIISYDPSAYFVTIISQYPHSYLLVGWSWRIDPFFQTMRAPQLGQYIVMRCKTMAYSPY